MRPGEAAGLMVLGCLVVVTLVALAIIIALGALVGWTLRDL